jgi:protein-L-isoaspartate O-methyltransferase/nicotinamidase-related amidase
MGLVPRHEFLPDGLRGDAYADRPLPIGFGRTMSQPFIVGLMTDLLRVGRDNVVLEIGTGSGYQAAVLAHLVRRGYTVEIIPGLAEAAADRLRRPGYDNVEMRVGDGYYGWEEAAPFDAAVVTAAATGIPPPLLRQLKPGGRMAIPVGAPFALGSRSARWSLGRRPDTLAAPKRGATSMNERIWDRFLTERDRAVFAAGGFGARAGFGKRPALLVIDVNWAFCGMRPEPILESIKRWRTSCGEESWVALEYIKSLVDAARAMGLPVIYTTGERRPDNWDAGSWRWKSARGEEASGSVHDGIDGNEIVAMIAPGPQDIVIRKQKPSGFFGTNLAAYLTLLGCDSVVVTGTTTSGCVRATVVDAFSLNYRVILAEEGCFDRSQASHAVSLCDMHAKYADVVPTAEILAYFKQLPTGLFDLPTGDRSPAPPVREAAE